MRRLFLVVAEQNRGFRLGSHVSALRLSNSAIPCRGGSVPQLGSGGCRSGNRLGLEELEEARDAFFSAESALAVTAERGVGGDPERLPDRHATGMDGPSDRPSPVTIPGLDVRAEAVGGCHEDTETTHQAIIAAPPRRRTFRPERTTYPRSGALPHQPCNGALTAGARQFRSTECGGRLHVPNSQSICRITTSLAQLIGGARLPRAAGEAHAMEVSLRPDEARVVGAIACLAMDRPRLSGS